jgi:tripartite-type tricarboxylate transporter receptor subunit TctC
MALPTKDPRKILSDKEWNKLSNAEKWEKSRSTQEELEQLLKPSSYKEFNQRFKRF